MNQSSSSTDVSISVSLCEAIKKFKELELDKQFKNKSFEFITDKIMTNKYVLITIYKLVNELKILINYKSEIIHPRVFLSIYLINYFKDDVLSSELEDKEIIMYDKSKELVCILEDLDSNYQQPEVANLIKKLNTYKFIFNDWQKTDLSSQIHIYTDMYHDYDKKIENLRKKVEESTEEDIQKNEELNPEYIDHLVELKNIIKNSIEKLVGKDKCDETINNHKYIEKTYDNSINELIKNYLHKAFWENFKKDLLSQPKNYSQLEGIIADINNFFKIIYKNRPEKYSSLSEYFDPEFISNCIKTDKLSNNEIKNLCKFLLIELKSVDAPSFDNNIQNLLEKLDNIDLEIETNFINEIVEILSYSLGRLEWISNTAEKVRNLEQ